MPTMPVVDPSNIPETIVSNATTISFRDGLVTIVFTISRAPVGNNGPDDQVVVSRITMTEPMFSGFVAMLSDALRSRAQRANPSKPQ